MIAARTEVLLKTGKHCLAVMTNLRGLAMKETRRSHHPATKDLTNRLMAEAHAEHRHLPGELFNYFHRNAGVAGRAGSRRNHDAIRRHRLDLILRDFVVAPHFDGFTQLA